MKPELAIFSKHRNMVFISYSRKDFQEVKEFNRLLESNGIKTWFDLHDVEFSSSFMQRISDGITSSDIILFMWTENSAFSEFSEKEVLTARQNGKRVIPILLKGYVPTGGWTAFFFSNINYVNANSTLEVQKLISELKSGVYHTEKLGHTMSSRGASNWKNPYLPITTSYLTLGRSTIHDARAYSQYYDTVIHPDGSATCRCLNQTWVAPDGYLFSRLVLTRAENFPSYPSKLPDSSYSYTKWRDALLRDGFYLIDIEGPTVKRTRTAIGERVEGFTATLKAQSPDGKMSMILSFDSPTARNADYANTLKKIEIELH